MWLRREASRGSESASVEYRVSSCVTLDHDATELHVPLSSLDTQDEGYL